MTTNVAGRAPGAPPPAPFARLWVRLLVGVVGVLLVAVLFHGAGYRLEAER